QEAGSSSLSLELCHLRLPLFQPESHAHLAVHRRRRGAGEPPSPRPRLRRELSAPMATSDRSRADVKPLGQFPLRQGGGDHLRPSWGAIAARAEATAASPL